MSSERKTSVGIAAVVLCALLAIPVFIVVAGFQAIHIHSDQVRSEFLEYVRSNGDEIRSSCEGLLAEIDERDYFAGDADELPSVIRNMDSSYVTLLPGLTRIEMAGGFEHRGLYVVAGDREFDSGGCLSVGPRIWYYEGE